MIVTSHKRNLSTAAGLDALHSMQVIHADVKPQNLLWFRQTGMYKVSDLGSVRFGWEARVVKDNLVTLPYRSIELLLGCRHVRPSIDMWALGVTIAELAHGSRVFQSTIMTSEIRSRASAHCATFFQSYTHTHQTQVPKCFFGLPTCPVTVSRF